MHSFKVASICFLFIFGGALLGLRVRTFLPEHHLSEDSRDVVKIGAGLIATLAALVLGLMISSARDSLDSMNRELTQVGAKIMLLDRIMANYGPETGEVRELLRTSLADTIHRIWPDNKTGQASTSFIETSRRVEDIQARISGLSPHSDLQRQLRSQSLQITADLAQSRWLLIEQTQQALPMAFLFVLLFWLVILFTGFGLLSRSNFTVIMVLFVCAISVSGAIFLILEMGTPVTGLINISSAPLIKALQNIGR
jgi:hypothetical protein